MNEHKSFIVEMAELIDRHLSRRKEQVENRPKPSRLSRALRWLTPNGGTLLLIAVLLLTQNAWARTAQSPAIAPGPSATTVNYQGRLADSGGSPLDGSYGMSFSLWDATADGNLVWGPENHAAVPVSEGLFSVGLGSQTSGGIPTNTWNGDRYLEIAVGGETLIPRELIRSVPVAGMALTVPDNTIGANQIADGAIDSRNAQLTVGRVQSVISGSYIDLTGDFQDIPGTEFTLTPETNQSFLIYVTVDIEMRAQATTAAILVVDGEEQVSRIISRGGGGNTDRKTLSQTYLVDLSPDTHTLVLRAYTTGDSSRVYGTHTTVTYIAVSQ